jgi:hypothetical protein
LFKTLRYVLTNLTLNRYFHTKLKPLKTKTMEQTNTSFSQPEQPAGKPQGKGLGVAGFVISLIALLLWIVISGIAIAAAAFGGGMGLAVFWLILSLLGTLLSIMGMMKLGKTGGKKGLAITGMVLGIIATILSVTTLMGVQKMKSTVGDKGKELLENFSDTAKLRESMNSMMDQLTDSLKSH